MSCKCGKEVCSCSQDLIPDKIAYQVNKRRMAWVLIILMGINYTDFSFPRQTIRSREYPYDTIYKYVWLSRGIFWF